jgi:hypothetical protein
MGTKITRLRKGPWEGEPGVYWAWKYDGYYDVHHAPEGMTPDGSDVVSECFPTLSEAREWTRKVVAIENLDLAEMMKWR